jgi:hypothetical protein
MIFSCSGDFGDIVYGLASVKYIVGDGEADYRLYPAPVTGNRMTPERAAIITPLLMAQPYISSVEYGDGPKGLDLDGWRRRPYKGHLNLADQTADWLGVPHSPRKEPWLFVEPEEVAPVVFAFGPRWRSWRVDWSFPRAVYADRAVFLGLPAEHLDFEARYGPIRHHRTPDLLSLARVVAGSRLVHCSQSCPRAIAEGLKRPVVVEIMPKMNNTHFAREDAAYL